MRNLLWMLMLSLPALALAAPDQVVSKVYNTHLKTQDMRKTIQQVPSASPLVCWASWNEP